MLPFQRHVFSELCAEDALLIIGRGMGLERLVGAFIELYAHPETLVLLVNGSAEICNYYNYSLAPMNGFAGSILDRVKSGPLFRFIDTDNSSSERAQLYMAGGVLAATSRVLLTDMLTDRLPIHMVTGLLVVDAHKITENSNEAFIIRLFRERNQVCMQCSAVRIVNPTFNLNRMGSSKHLPIVQSHSQLALRIWKNH
jgi:DNA excision repair protein ERCC-4